MTQKGSTFRAAIPRQNMPDQPYSQRAPRKWLFVSGFTYLSIPVDLDFLDHTENCIYVPASIAWTWVYTDSALFGPFIVRISLQWTGRPGWVFHINVHIAATAANMDVEWALGPNGKPNHWYLGAFPNGISPTVTGDPGFFLTHVPKVQSVRYSEEP
jgi:hypothetical protein